MNERLEKKNLNFKINKKKLKKYLIKQVFLLL